MASRLWAPPGEGGGGDGLTQEEADLLYEPLGGDGGDYLTQAEADALYQPIGDYLTEAEADALFLTSAEGDALFLTQAEADALFLTQAEADALFLTQAEADALFLTPAEGNAAYSPVGALTQAAADLLYEPLDANDYLTEAEADALYEPIGGGGGAGPGPPVSLGSQAITAATPTLITGSKVPKPSGGLVAGTTLRWVFDASKTSAGAVANTFEVRVGTNGTIADPVVQSFTTVVGTAVQDIARFEIQWTIVSPGAAATHMGVLRVGPKSATATAGWLNRPGEVIVGTPTAFNSTTGGLFISVSATTGAGMVVDVLNCVACIVNTTN
jgi:hypothetical protein